MRRLNGFSDAVRQASNGFAGRLSNSSNQGNTTPPLKRRSGLELSGSFLLIAVLAIVGAGVRAEHNTNPASAAAKSPTHSVEVGQGSGPTLDNESAGSVSARVTSSITSNGADTKVTVNGQSVEVPTNGTTEKTVTSPNGSTSVKVTSGQSSNSNVYNSSITTDNSSSSSIEQKSGGQ